MHEYSLILAVLDRVEQEAVARGGAAVHRIRVHIGALSGVEPALLASAFDIARSGTRCEAAVLDIATVPARWSCPTCAAEPAPGHALQCPACGVPARLTSGDELVLDQIEMEVP
jgi:hydrogenase nickel incorporation protein HypA/HybF